MKSVCVCRLFVCLLLVFALVLNVSPIGVQAAAAPALVKVAVAAVPVIAGALMGIGIFAGQGEVFSNLVDNVKTKLTSLGFIHDDKIDVLSVKDAVTGENKYYVPQEAIEATRDYAFESGAVSLESVNVPIIDAGGNVRISSNTVISCPVDAHLFTFYPSSGYSSCNLYLVSLEPFTNFIETWYNGSPVYERDARTYTYDDITFYYAYKSATRSYLPSHVEIVLSAGYLDYIGQVLTGEIIVGESILVADGLIAGTIGSSAIDISEAYPKWSSGKIDSEEDGNPKPYWPVGHAGTLVDTLAKTQEEIWTGISDYTTQVLDNWTGLFEILNSIRSWVSSIPSKIDAVGTSIGTKIDAVTTAVATYVQQVISGIEAIPGAFQNWIEQIIELLRGLAGTITDAIVDVISVAFAMDPEYLRSEIDSLLNNFVFLRSLVDFGRNLVDVFYGIGSKPPVLYVDLDAAESDIDYGDRVVFLDLTWYERYKPYGDAIISSFLWAWFGWRLLHTLPGLINGSSGAVPHINIRKWG